MHILHTLKVEQVSGNHQVRSNKYLPFLLLPLCRLTYNIRTQYLGICRVSNVNHAVCLSSMMVARVIWLPREFYNSPSEPLANCYGTFSISVALWARVACWSSRVWCAEHLRINWFKCMKTCVGKSSHLVWHAWVNIRRSRSDASWRITSVTWEWYARMAKVRMFSSSLNEIITPNPICCETIRCRMIWTAIKVKRVGYVQT